MAKCEHEGCEKEGQMINFISKNEKGQRYSKRVFYCEKHKLDYVKEMLDHVGTE